MGVSFRDLRDRCQLPVRDGNDVAGLLFGDWASLPLTKLFVDWRLSPSIATVGMLITGIAGSALQLPGHPWPVVGAALLLLYYVLDCVDGEVARWQGVENIQWGYYEYIFHLLVKPVCFLGVGTAIYLETGRVAYVLAAAAAAIATLWLKILVELPSILFVKGVISSPPGKDRAYKFFARTLDLPEDAFDADESRPSGGSREIFPLGVNLVTLRALGTNFDVGLVFLVIATVLDTFVTPLALPLLGDTSLRGIWMAYYGVVLPLDFLDYLRTYLMRGHFSGEMKRLLVLSHHYKVSHVEERDPQGQAGSDGAD